MSFLSTIGNAFIDYKEEMSKRIVVLQGIKAKDIICGKRRFVNPKAEIKNMSTIDKPYQVNAQMYGIT